MNGGKITAAQIDQLSQLPQATALTISGLEQKTLEHLVKHFGAQFTALHFWKCPRIAELAPLEDMPRLTHVAFYWNQKTTRLWNFARTPALRGLHFDDFTKLTDLRDLESATSLDTLVFGNAVWNKFAVETLDPLAALGKTLRRLAFSVKSIGDGRIAPLASLGALEELDLPSNLFTTGQLAWLRAHLPATVESTAIEPFRRLSQPLMRRGKPLDVLICGKGKPFLSSQDDAAKIEGYVAEFRQMVDQFARDRSQEPVG
ncbi:MAG: hypothetical protein WBP72_16215 [Rhodocyclaceae bacterium]